MDAELNSESFDIEELRAEVLKWQERVPKLATALRERTDELAAARDELRILRQSSSATSGDVDARVKARDELIAELEKKVEDANARHREAAGQLSHLQLDLTSASEDAESWKRKWQSVTQTLDDAVADKGATASKLEAERQSFVSQKEQLTELHAQELRDKDDAYASLKARNDNLIETTDLANKQIEALGSELKQLMDQSHADHEAVEAAQAHLTQRDEQIASLEQEVAELSSKLQASESQGVELDQALEQLRTELRETKESLEQAEQANASQLDAQSQLRARIEHLEDELGHAQSRAQVLQGQLDELNIALTEKQEALVEQGSVCDELERKLDASQSEIDQVLQAKQQAESHALTLKASTQQQATQIRGLIAEAQGHEDEIAAMQSSLEAKDAQIQREIQEADKQRERVDEQALEIERLSACIEGAQETTTRKEDQTRLLGERVEELERTNEKLQSGLDERAAIIREFEEERQSATDKQENEHKELERKLDDLQQSLEKAERDLTESQHRVKTYSDHAHSLEDKLSSQQNLMQSLEEELSEERLDSAKQAKLLESMQRDIEQSKGKREDELNEAQKAADSLLLRNEELEDNLSAHEEMLDSLAKQLSEQQTQLEAAADELQVANAKAASLSTELNTVKEQARHDAENLRPQLDGDSAEEMAELKKLLRDRTEEADEMRWRLEQANRHTGDDMVMVLSQQLKDARDENERLQQRMKQNDHHPEATKVALEQQPSPPDDLTQLKGIGDVLAAQLAEVGVNSFAQIAALDESALEAQDHPLHSFYSRIVRDGWIEQARDLAGGEE